MDRFHKLDVVKDSFFVGSTDICTKGLHTSFGLHGIQECQSTKDFTYQVFFFER